MSKKGQMGIIYFFAILFIILIVGFVVSIILGAVGYVSPIVTSTFTGLPTVDGANLSQASQYSIGTANTMVSALPWIVGFAYLIALIGSIAFVLGFGDNGNPMFMGAYFVFMVFLILIAIVISNAYQDVWTGTDVLAQQLQSQTMLSYLILYSPEVFAIIGFLTGIYLFAGRQNEQGGTPSGI